MGLSKPLSPPASFRLGVEGGGLCLVWFGLVFSLLL